MSDFIFALHDPRQSTAGGSQRGARGRPALLLDIAVEPKNFTAECMRRVAERLRAVYCRENYLGVVIFDGKKDRTGWHYDPMTTVGKVDRRRGKYLFDGEKMIGRPEFSAEPGNPLDEIKTDLSKPVSVLKKTPQNFINNLSGQLRKLCFSAREKTRKGAKTSMILRKVSSVS